VIFTDKRQGGAW